MTLDTLPVAAPMTLGDRHLKPACFQVEGASDRRPSLLEREEKRTRDSIEGGGAGRGVKRCARTAQPCHTITSGCGYIAVSLLKVFFSAS